MQQIYCISGLGADQQIFKRLTIKGATLVPVHWADYDNHDDLPCYAQKISAQITAENPVILGLSFGGMIASEIAKIRPVKQVFLLSSAKDATELPPVGGFVRFIVDHKLVPTSLSKIPNKVMYERFGVETDEEKKLLMDILRKTDGGFTRWALKSIINWQSRDHVDNIIHIHGTKDKMIFPEFVKPTHWIEGGTHFMTWQRAGEISTLIDQQLHHPGF